MSKRIGHPIATRRFGVEGEPGREIILVIGQPIQPGSTDGDWACPVLISGLENEVFRYAEGIDGVQAIQQAMQVARSELERCGLMITWLDQEPGEIGLPLPLESPFGLWFQRKLELLVEDEIRKVAEVQEELFKVRDRRARKKP
ncbi:DUF6968 family protein [Sorangium sp. So ce1389]|uniref:DUF6968 family protein n=1 Tax=Sorangium sp. So ce1389 TaxID=3133336 RepID=UPI003F639A1F